MAFSSHSLAVDIGDDSLIFISGSKSDGSLQDPESFYYFFPPSELNSGSYFI